MIEIYAVNVKPETMDCDYERFLEVVSDSKKEKMIQSHGKKNAIHSLCGEILARIAIRNRLDISNQEIRFKYSEHGKPYFDGIDDVFFNISHSGDWVVCAIASHEVGIDIEKMKSNNLKLAEHFFTKEEYQELLCKPETEQTQYFYSLWTLKECYLKWSGKGLTVPLNSFAFHVDHELIELISKEHIKPKFRQYQIDEEYKISVCSQEEMCEEIIFIDLKSVNL